MTPAGAGGGLQVERTALARGRSTLSTLALGLLLVRIGVMEGRPLEIVTGLAAVLLAGATAVGGDLRLLGIGLPVLCALTLAVLLNAA